MARLFLVLGLAAVLAGCGGSKSGSPTTTGPATTVVVTVEPTASVPVTTAPGAEPDCGSGAFLPVLKEAFDGAAPKMTIVEARVERCRNGFAQVFAVPDPSVCEPGVDHCYETEQVFLAFEDGRWAIETTGTGLACGSESQEGITEICRGLGYPDLDTPAFQLPSRNIGCLLGGGVLRCDILSGLSPEPATACELDWVGIVLEREGAAEPQCAGDTVYQGAAPTLAYGETWRRKGFECESSDSGLSCRSPGGATFKLARDGWIVS